MRHCYNEAVNCYEATGDNLPDLLRDAAETLDSLPDYAWADLKVSCYFDDDTHGPDFLLSMDVH